MASNLHGEKVRLGLLRHAVAFVADRPSPKRIPMSGIERLRSRNYFMAFFQEPAGKGRFLFKSIDIEDLTRGMWWEDENAEPVEREFTLDELSRLKAEYIQYESEIEIQYSSTLEFVVSQWLRLPALRLRYTRFLHWIWGRRTLVRNERMKVLRHMVNRLDGEDQDSASAETLMNEFYGETWWYTKNALKDHAYYRLLLESMVVTGDVSHRDGYKITPQALQTLSNFELEERRHCEATKLQKGIVWLTVILALIGFLQVAVAALAYFRPPTPP